MSAAAGRPLRVAFVVDRHGEGVNGGAETLCRALVRRLANRREIGELRVLTTCARDHLTWANHFPKGESRVDGVRVERFPVWWRRWPRLQRYAFNGLATHLRSRWLEAVWLLAQGPYAPGLVRRVRSLSGEVDAFVFVTYLYHPTVRGLPAVHGRAVLLGTAHDEPAIGAPGFRALFGAARAIACLSGEEAEFLRGRFGLQGHRLEVVGSGLDATPSAAEMDAARPALPQAPSILYVGRVEGEKGVPELIEGLRAFKRLHGGETFTDDGGRTFGGDDLRLLLAGRGTLEAPLPADVVSLGFVSEAAKHALVRDSLLLVSPSRYESLSLSLLEAWQHARPALVNAHCAVTSGQVARSRGGAAYDGAEGFAQALARALREPAWRAECGAAGRAFVAAEYGWDAVEARWLALLAEVAA